MNSYIVNTDTDWYNYIVKNTISYPVFWFKRDSTPNANAIQIGNLFFLRITSTQPPAIKHMLYCRFLK
jgi:hypothetical protein